MGSKSGVPGKSSTFTGHDAALNKFHQFRIIEKFDMCRKNRGAFRVSRTFQLILQRRKLQCCSFNGITEFCLFIFMATTGLRNIVFLAAQFENLADSNTS
ncbi:MAG: hypothetical protein ACD_39C00833G0001 [uncultured bacterium]|nr:MAG: hypothetical protein ACD_39C00833G0001 [uncultured bacterium]